jgi:hypothetical protein
MPVVASGRVIVCAPELGNYSCVLVAQYPAGFVKVAIGRSLVTQEARDGFVLAIRLKTWSDLRERDQ